ncbi:hypothetical protein [Variovorax saccharolyticus]|uniref:hypothetical protein n=1 Tax=Variovorax saccharolyticus TaxID=3053516 RepID=UPI00257717F8|nr:hypothetical protein [Variovorax sp. J22R187]MDM0017571.1 hypothetical protein [Variovorax sp. J22R187]
MFYRKLSTKPMAEQLVTIKAMDLFGIYVYRRSYADNGGAVVLELTRLTGHPPALPRADGAISFFRLNRGRGGRA